MYSVLCAEAGLQSNGDYRNAVHGLCALVTQLHPEKQEREKKRSKKDKITWWERIYLFLHAKVSHVAVVALQQQLSICVKQQYDPLVLMNYSHYYLKKEKKDHNKFLIKQC